jgi:hypothetical protein
MRKVFLSVLALIVAGTVLAQKDTSVVSKPAAPSVQVSSLPRGNDHLLIQLGYLNWNGIPDSIYTKGLPRTFNAYIMFNFPFKTSPNWSSAVGVGIATDNMYFDKMYVDLKSTATRMPFTNLADTNHFKRFKVATAYLEAPVELRYSTNPDNDKSSLKFAVGVKIATLLSAHSKGVDQQNSSGTTLNSYTEKESSKKYFNTTRFSATARIGMGHFSLFGSYAITPLLKDAVGPVIHPLTIGLTLSGL